ncbi:hypothetical protein [Hoeflea halophila]|uniref:hypothetical protein n=1 Tax=Hoeflea halophila TaxID=714899 RepID=UPI001179F8CF|nr:hypothetical protein [Hoeflea halophila]
MTEYEKLQRDIAGLKESIRLDWLDLDSLSLDAKERQGIRQSTDYLIQELKGLLERLERLDSDRT